MTDLTKSKTKDTSPQNERARKSWRRPVLNVLPADQTAGSHLPGTDGGGNPTSSS